MNTASALRCAAGLLSSWRSAMPKPSLSEIAQHGTFPVDSFGNLQLSVDMHPVPAMLQHALTSGDMTTGHVAFQSMERLLYQAYGQDRTVPAHQWDNLRNFGIAQRAVGGAASVHLMHGPGSTGGNAPCTPKAFFDSHNSGQYSDVTTTRALPAAARHGPQLHCMLDFWEAVFSDGDSVTFSLAENCATTLTLAGFDGMSLGEGALVDESALVVDGFENPVDADEAARVLKMDDEQLHAWSQEHPRVKSAMEFMVNLPNNKRSGHIGFMFVVNEGTHVDVARRTAEMLRPLFTCYHCLHSEWHDGMTPEEEPAALKRAMDKCDVFCAACLRGNCGEHSAGLWKRQCSCCKDKVLPTKMLLCGMVFADQIGQQGALFRKAHEGTLAASLEQSETISASISQFSPLCAPCPTVRT